MAPALKEYDRCKSIGGSDARIIMGTDEKAIIRLWQEKRGERERADLTHELIVRLGLVTEDLNKEWFEHVTGRVVIDTQKRFVHRSIDFMTATLDGRIKDSLDVFESKFMLPWSFSEEAAASKHMAQLQHNMLVAGSSRAVLSIINGGGRWVEIWVDADPIYQTLLIAAEKAFWRAVNTGNQPSLINCESPKPRIEAVRIVDMAGSNSWGEFASIFLRTRSAYFEHERAKSELKALVPDDAKQASGHGVKAKRSKSGAIILDAVEVGGFDASHQ